MHGGGWKGIFVFTSAHALFCLAAATTCTSPITVSSYCTTPIPIAYNNSPTADPLCFTDGSSLSCSGGALLLDSDTGSAELDTSKVFAWDREVNIASIIPLTKVRQANLFFYNIPSSGIGLPPAELFWDNANAVNPDIPLSHTIVGNQDLSQDDRTLRNVSLVITTDLDDPSFTDYRFFRIHFTFPAETSLIDWILLSEVQLCGESVALPTTSIRFLQPPSMESPVPPGPDNVVSAANLSCTVANEGSFQWQWTPPPGITFSQMWIADGTRTSIVQISAANTGDYTCRASFNGQSANTSIAFQLNQMLVSSPNTTVTLGDPSATLSCELYGYLMRQPSTITWNFGSDVLMNDSVFTITVQDGSHMIQNGGDTPRPSMRSVLTINRPNRTHVGSYICSNGLRTRIVALQVSILQITFQQPLSMEPPVRPGPDNVVSAANLSCTVTNEGSFQWQWTPPPGVTLSQMWVVDGTRTSIVEISQISAANAGDYSCRVSFNGQSANTSIIAVQLNQMLSSPSTTTVTIGDPSATLSCELYGYLMRQPPAITWNFDNDVLMNDSVFTVTVQDGSHMIQNGGDTPQPSLRSVLTINHPNRTHDGSYICSVRGGFSGLRIITLQVVEATLTESPSTNIIGLAVGLPLGVLLLTVVFLITTVAVVIAVRVQLSRKKEEIPAYEAEYEVVGPPRPLPGPDLITTDMNVAYGFTNPNTVHRSTNF